MFWRKKRRTAKLEERLWAQAATARSAEARERPTTLSAQNAVTSLDDLGDGATELEQTPEIAQEIAPETAEETPAEPTDKVGPSASSVTAFPLSAGAPRAVTSGAQAAAAASSTPENAPSPEARLLEDPIRVFGEIVSMLGKDPDYRERPLSDLAWIVGPAIASKQALVARARPADAEGPGRRKTPVGAILWARVSPEVDQALRDCGGRLDVMREHQDAWTSGEHVWIVAISGPDTVQDSMVRYLDQKTGQGRPPTRLIP